MPIIFLTGSPDNEAIRRDDACPLSSFLPQFNRFLQQTQRHGPERDNSAPSSAQLASLPLAKWRAIAVANTNPEPTRDAQFLSPQHEPHAREHLHFLEHSLAILQNLDSSQIGLPDGTYDDTTALTCSSFATTPSTDLSDGSLATYSPERPAHHVVGFDGPVMDLNGIPNARHLRAIHPQTMTVNVLVGVITVQPTRTVRLRKRDAEMDIIEVLVGDDTRAGFTISFWLAPLDGQDNARTPARDARRQLLSGLRAGNVLLITHLALSEFNGSVYGQSLSRRITKNNTSVVVLADKVVGLPTPTATKLARVREWSDNFVGKKRAASPVDLSSADNKRRRTMDLPPETQADET